MKKFLLLFVFAGLTTGVIAQTLFTYGNLAVDKAEFIRAYNKNQVPVTDKEKALRDYLDLYVKFKLKVKAAMDLGMDTMPQLQYDVQSFRSQILDSYLNNEKALNGLLDEAFERSQKDLQVLHFYIPVAATLQPSDTQKVAKSISEIYSALAAGKTDYDKICETTPVKANHSNLGYITAFSLPYEYENIVYNLKPGQASKPYQSKNGWHVFKLIDERKAVGKWKVAQILFSVPPQAGETERNEFKKKADSVYQLLQKGEDFGKMARWFSDDKVTYGNSGEMAEFGTGKYRSSFENEVFKLTRNNEISKPFLTEYGYHIVKRLSQTPVSADKNDKTLQYELKQNIQKDARVNIAKNLFTKEIFKQVNFKKLTAVNDANLFRYADSVISQPNSKTDNLAVYPIANKPVCSFAKKTLTGKDWLDFIRNYKGSGELYQGESNAALIDKFFTISVMEYYRDHLEDFNAEFRYQMDEFKAGNVLFEIMEKNIWGKAAADTVGLQKVYEQNKHKYLWAASADIIMFNCANKDIAETGRSAILAGKDWRQLVAESNNNIQTDSGRFDLAQIPVTLDPDMQAGAITKITENPADGNASFVKLVKRYEANLQRNYEESKGLAINDYQNALEDNWIAELKKKYPVKINEAVFKSLLVP
ncbi:MAG: peptidylprolyl isomerase [Chitinophagaceae bacterium]|nr:peptidylprolyl isomerase [Chitinophagaceae bacterium]